MSSYNDIGALSVRLNLETGSFNKKVSAINKEIKFLERDFKSAGKGIKNFENSFKGLSSKITMLNKQIGLSGDKLKLQKKQMDEYSKALKKQSSTLAQLEQTHGKTSSEYKKQAQLVGQIASKMRSLDVAIKTTEGNLRDYKNQLTEAKSKMEALGTTTKTFTQKLEEVQQESKLTASHFEKMLSSLDEGSFKHASVEMDKLSASIKSAKNEAQIYKTEIERLESSQTKLLATEQRLSSEIQEVASKLSKAKSKYGETSTQAEKLELKLAELKITLTETKAKHSENVSAIRDHKTELNKLEAQASQTAQQLERIPVDTVTGKFANIGSSMMNTGAMLSASVGLPLTMVGKNAITTAMNFEEGMSKVQAITGQSGKVMADLEEQARHLGATTQFSATESAEAMSYLGMAGLKADDIMKAMPATLDIAKAGMLDLGTTADITTNIMSGFNMTASDFSHIGDVLAYASSNANTNIQQMGEAMVYLAPVGSTLGLSLEDVSSAVMAVSDAGIQGARAGAAFSTSLVRLTKPTKAMKDVMEELNLSFTESDGSMKPISKIVGELNGKMSKYTDAQKAATINTLFGAEATKHWSALLQVGEDKLKGNTKALEKCDGTAKEMAKTMADNLAGSVKEMKSKMEDMAITIGYSLKPTIEKITKTIGKLTDWFANLTPNAQETIVKMGMMAVALPVVTMVSGALVSSLGNLYKGLNFVTKGAGNFISKISKTGKTSGTVAKGMSKLTPLMTNPWVALAGAVAIGGTAIYKYRQFSDEQLEKISKEAKNKVTGVGDYFSKDLPQAFKDGKKQLEKVEFFDDNTKNSIIRNMNSVEEAIKTGSGNVSLELDDLIGDITGNMDKVPKEMKESVAKGLAELAVNITKDGQASIDEMKEWAKQIEEASGVKLEINFDELETTQRMGRWVQDYASVMSKEVRTKIQATGNDISQTVETTSQAIQKGTELNLDEFKKYSSGITQYLGDIKGSTRTKVNVMQQLIGELYKKLSPEQLSVLMSQMNSEWQLGTDGILGIQTGFIAEYSSADEKHRSKVAEGYAQFIKDTGEFNSLLQGEFGGVLQANGQFWTDFIVAMGGKKEEVKANATGIKDAYVDEIKAMDDPVAIAKAVGGLDTFVNSLVERKIITKDEASQMQQGINEELAKIDEEVITQIKANKDQFTKEEQAVLQKLGLLDKSKATPKVDADNSKANKKLDDTKKKSSDTKKSVEKDVAKTDVDNKNANKKLDDTKKKSKDTKANVEKDKAKFTVENGEALTRLGKVKSEIESIPLTKKVSIVVSAVKKFGSWVGNLFSGGSKKGKTIDIEPSTYSVASRMTQINSDLLNGTSQYTEGINNVSDSFTNVSRVLSGLDFSGSQYRSKPSVNETTVINSSDPQLLEAVNTLTSEVKSLNQRQNVVEAQLYIDGKQLKSHMQTIEKRQNRLSGK